MNRKDLITKLMNEGFTEKTLVILSDKQLHMLAERVITEQYTSTYGVTSAASRGNQTFIPKEKLSTPEGQAALKNAMGKRAITSTYESEMKEESNKTSDSKKRVTNMAVGFVSEDSEKQKKKEEDKKTINDRLHNKIQNCIKNKKNYKSYIELAKRVNDGKLPEKIQSLLPKKETSEKLNEWVDKVVIKHHFPSASKADIMNLIENKIQEQWEEDTDVATEPETANFEDVLSYDKLKELSGKDEMVPGLDDLVRSIRSGSAEPEIPVIEPDVKPGKPDTKEDVPYNPFEPGPGIDPNPKAVSPEVAPRPETLPDTEPGTTEDEPFDPFQPGPGIDPNPKAINPKEKIIK